MDNTSIHRGIISPGTVYPLPETVEVELEGRDYPCREFISTKDFGNVPILDINLMSDEREREIVERQKKLHPEMYAEYYSGIKKG